MRSSTRKQFMVLLLFIVMAFFQVQALADTIPVKTATTMTLYDKDGNPVVMNYVPGSENTVNVPAKAPLADKLLENPEKLEKKMNILMVVFKFIMDNWTFFAVFFAGIFAASYKSIIAGIGKIAGFWNKHSKEWREKYGNLNVFDVADFWVSKITGQLQDYVDKLKAASADGQLSQEEIKSINEMFLHEFQKQVPDIVQAMLKAFVKDVPSFLLGRVKDILNVKKKTGASVLMSRLEGIRH